MTITTDTTFGDGRGRPRRIHLYPAGAANFLGPRFHQLLSDIELVVLDDEDAFAAQVDEIEVLFANEPPSGHWTRASKLRLIHSPGAGVEKLLAAPDLPADVPICNASGVHEPHMAEFALAMLLSIVKRLPRLHDQQRDHRWRVVMPPTLSGMRACVVGLGAIGTSIAVRLAALGVSVVGVNRSGRPVAGVDAVHPVEDLASAMAGCDVAIVVVPRTAGSVGLIGAAELSTLNPRSYLVDVSRGGVTDIQAVVDALAGERLAAAAMDVFDTEPLPADSPLWDVPNLMITPHTAGWSPGYRDGLATVIAANIDALATGARFQTPVDRSLGY